MQRLKYIDQRRMVDSLLWKWAKSTSFLHFRAEDNWFKHLCHSMPNRSSVHGKFQPSVNLVSHAATFKERWDHSRLLILHFQQLQKSMHLDAWRETATMEMLEWVKSQLKQLVIVKDNHVWSKRLEQILITSNDFWRSLHDKNQLE
jgi:hypothetical protein